MVSDNVYFNVMDLDINIIIIIIIIIIINHIYFTDYCMILQQSS